MDKGRDLIEKADKERTVKSWRNPQSNVAYISQLSNTPIILEELIQPETSNYDLAEMMPKKFYFQVAGNEKFLSKRELECVLQLIQGKSTVEIAKKLFVSPRTIESHIEALKLKTGLSNRQHIIEFFVSMGLSKII